MSDPVTLDKSLHVVLPIRRPDGDKADVIAWVHAAPIPMPVFEAHFRIISRVWTEIYKSGQSVFGGARIAHLLFKDLATQSGDWAGPTGVENTLIAEINRLANVYAPGPQGWTMHPWHSWRDSGAITPRERSEVENALAFFTCACSMHTRTALETVLDVTASLWDWQITASDCTAFGASLRTSTAAATLGEAPRALSAPL